MDQEAGSAAGLVSRCPSLKARFMFVTLDDFRINPRNFDLTKSANILRIICGAFMFPHIAGKFAGGALSAATVGFFAKAGFHPPELWVYAAACAEAASGIALILG